MIWWCFVWWNFRFESVIIKVLGGLGSVWSEIWKVFVKYLWGVGWRGEYEGEEKEEDDDEDEGWV